MLVECARIGLARIAMVLADVEEFDGIVTDIVERLIIDDDLEEASLTIATRMRKGNVTFTFWMAPRNPSKMMELCSMSNERYCVGRLPMKVNERGQRVCVENNS